MSSDRYNPSKHLVRQARMAEYLADELGGSEQEWWWFVREYKTWDQLFADIDYLRSLAASDE